MNPNQELTKGGLYSLVSPHVWDAFTAWAGT